MEVLITVMTIASAGYYGLDLILFVSRRVKAWTLRRVQRELDRYPVPQLPRPWQVVDSDTGETRTYH